MSKIKIDVDLFRQMRLALNIANAVLDKTRFHAMDQNPQGVRDLVGSAALAANRVDENQLG